MQEAQVMLQLEKQHGPTKSPQDATAEIMMKYVLRANGPDGIKQFQYVIFCNHINLNIRDNRIKITWRFFCSLLFCNVVLLFYVVLFRFVLLNVVYLICVVSISVVLFSVFCFVLLFEPTLEIKDYFNR